jgi:hypothetical protein
VVIYLKNQQAAGKNHFSLFITRRFDKARRKRRDQFCKMKHIRFAPVWAGDLYTEGQSAASAKAVSSSRIAAASACGLNFLI